MSKSLFTTIIEEVAPTTETAGVVGQLYLNSVEKKLYQCVAINTETVDEVETTTYTWQYISKDPNILINNGTGTGTTNCDYAILIGSKAGASHGGVADNGPIVIGYKAGTSNQTDAIVIGREAHANAGGYAIGAYAEATNGGGISIGRKAKSNAGIAIGSSAIGYPYKNIQLGTGTNTQPNTMQI